MAMRRALLVTILFGFGARADLLTHPPHPTEPDGHLSHFTLRFSHPPPGGSLGVSAALGGAPVLPADTHGVYIAHARSQVLRDALSHPWLSGLFGVEPVTPERKLHHNLRAESGGNISSVRLLTAALSSPVNPEAVARGLRARGLQVLLYRNSTGKAHFLLKDPSQAKRAARLIAQQPGVRWVEPQGRRTHLNHIATWSVQSSTPDRYPLYERGIDGSGEVVHIGDTGLDSDSCFFYDPSEEVAVYPSLNPRHRKILSYVPCVRPDTRQTFKEDRPHAHGTHVSGSVAGEALGGDNANNGLARKAKIFFNDMACDEPDLGLPIDVGYDFLAPGKAAGAHVSHNSWGIGPQPKTYIALDREADRFSYLNQDFLVVVAAGNDARAGVISPANSKNVLSVGAHRNTASRGGMASFSAVGPTWDNRRKPEIAAPGEPVTSADSNGAGVAPGHCETSVKSGTSMAAPFVSGGALLLRQYFKSGYHPSGEPKQRDAFEPSAPLLKALIVASAQPVPGFSWTPNDRQGFGRLALDHATFFGDEADSTHLLLVNNHSVAEEGRFDLCFTVDTSVESKATRLRAALVWMDPPPAEGSSRTMLNDLDLVVQDPMGNLHKAGAGYDRNNPTEVVDIAKPAAGAHRLTVYGYKVSEHAPYRDGLPFAVVVMAPGVREGKCEAKCPKDCGHGSCDKKTGLCACMQFWDHVDCSECSSKTFCNGHGVCSLPGKPKSNNLQCTCAEGFDPSSRCSACVQGHVGLQCTAKGGCVHGVLGKSGDCECYDDNKRGHWGGKRCERCATDWRGGHCSQRSHWCRDHETVSGLPAKGGWLQVNGEQHYRNSLDCRWLIESPQGQTVRLSCDTFHVEDGYDWFAVYQGVSSSADTKRVAFRTGSGSFEVSIPGGKAFVEFQSDLYDEGGQGGFQCNWYTV
eukprot:Hpha_TRINITY_DN15426_c3_g4::TRINITY_DN15426_c3_g4_i1::g.176586::m.176586